MLSQKRRLCLFSFGITNFWGADIIRGDTVFQYHCVTVKSPSLKLLFSLSMYPRVNQNFLKQTKTIPSINVHSLIKVAQNKEKSVKLKFIAQNKAKASEMPLKRFGRI